MKIKFCLFTFVFILVIFSFGNNLNPFSPSMFIFHDETQPARIQQFVLDLRNLQIPPRVAPDFSFKMGYPVFNFYAPAPYWITSIFAFIGFDIVSALKLSFLLSILVGFIAAYLFLKECFDFFPSLTGAVLYVSSLYYPLDIFVRGNLGEAWFLALFPLALFLIEKQVKKPTPVLFFFLTVIFSLLFTVHNLLSLVSVFLIFVFILIRPHRKIGVHAIVLALLLSSYFLVPLIAESHLTYASYVARLTNYADHFLCPSQLWQSQWGYGGSIKGCTDGMSFQIGKVQLILAVFGMLIFLLNLKKHNKKNVYFLLITLGSLYMTTYLSKPVWDFFSPVLSIFQFPWRFIAFSLIGISFFSSYFLHNVKIPFKNILCLILAALLIGFSSKYFSGITYAKQDFEKKFLSQEYIEKEAAYKIPEYLPRTFDYNEWRSYEKNPPKKPLRKISSQETPVEKFSNYMTLFAFAVLLYIMRSKKLWKKIGS